MSKYDFEIPEDLSSLGSAAAHHIMATLTRELGKAPDGGGCTAFYSPAEWLARGEKYGRGAELIVVHDGGDQASFFSYDYENYGNIDKMNETLEELGLYAEQCTCWYTAIYMI